MPEIFTSAHYLMQAPTRANPSRLAPPNVSDGTIEYLLLPYPLTAGTDEAATDLIKLCILPAGIIPRPDLSRCICDADPGTALTVDVGTAANPDGWGDGIAMTAAGPIEFCAAAHTAPAWLACTPLVGDTATPGSAVVYATIMTATAPVAGVVVYFGLAYQRNK